MATDPSLKVSAHVLVQLGSELVTDVEQALLECVKNSYDADSPGCTISIDTRVTGYLKETRQAQLLKKFNIPAENVYLEFFDEEGEHRLDGDNNLIDSVQGSQLIQRRVHYTGRVTIEDHGDGITPEKINNSWLMISGSAKRNDKGGPKKKTVKGRTPLGDKGLGRLGTMKLGDVLRVESSPSKDQPIAHAHFRWADCEAAETVEQVPVFTRTVQNKDRFKGTKVSVLGLHDIPEWRRKGRLLEITRSLAKLVSPFEATSTFPVSVSLDGDELSLVSVTNQILDRAVAKFNFEWVDVDGKRVLRARALFKKRLFSSTRSKKQKQKADLAFLGDDGKGFLEFLSVVPRAKKYEKNASPGAGWYLEFSRDFTWSEMLLDNPASIKDPGPFEGAFYFFHLDERDIDDSVAAGVGITSELIKGIAGISLLRDGFRVRSQGDWLGLSIGMTTGSIYHMRVNNTVGYFSLSGHGNYNLVEKSDREGFVEDAFYRGFFQIAEQCREFANNALEDVRRALDDYYKSLLEKGANNLANKEEPLAIMERSVEKASAAREAVARTSVKLGGRLDQLAGQLVRDGSAATAKAAMQLAADALKVLSEAQQNLVDSSATSDAVKLLRHEQDQAAERSMALFESAAVGLSARGLAHELRTHLTDLRQRITALLKLAKENGSEQSVLPHVRAMRASCSAIASAASLIDPLLPRTRNLKDTFGIREFIGEYSELRKEAFQRAEIGLRIVGGELTVRANRARLLQVLDNLVRNSVYWLRRGLPPGAEERDKSIVIEVGAVGFSVADSGPGVDPKFEDSLFDIFVTAKPAQDPGQGLGLFIVRQLLQADGCDIELSGDRNPEGRRYRFKVDLGAVVVSR